MLRMHTTRPVAIPTAVVSRIPINMAAGTRRASSADVASKPKTASRCADRAGCPRSPAWQDAAQSGRVVESDESDEQAHSAATAAYSSNGIAAIINCRMPNAVRIRKALRRRTQRPGCLPGNPHAFDNGVSEISIQSHAGR